MSTIIVLVKQVPDTNAKIAVQGGRVDLSTVKMEMSPYDGFAIETALRHKEASGGTVTALTVGGAGTEKILKDAKAMGVDNIVRVWDDSWSELDSNALQSVLKESIESLGGTTVYCGKSAADTGAGSTGPGLAERLGWANASNVIGAEFGEALNQHLYESFDGIVTPAARKIVLALQQGINAAAELARASDMDRAFAIAPTASCSYRYTDRAGYTTAPELAPPIGRTVDRDSSTFGVQQYDYGDVETAEDVGWNNYKTVVDGIMEMLSRTVLAHGYSYNTWSDVVIYNDDFINDWLRSPQTSMYYSLQVMQNTQAKDDALAALDGDFGEMFGFDDIEEQEDANYSVFNDPAACVGCAE